MESMIVGNHQLNKSAIISNICHRSQSLRSSLAIDLKVENQSLMFYTFWPIPNKQTCCDRKSFFVTDALFGLSWPINWLELKKSKISSDHHQMPSVFVFSSQFDEDDRASWPGPAILITNAGIIWVIFISSSYLLVRAAIEMKLTHLVHMSMLPACRFSLKCALYNVDWAAVGYVCPSIGISSLQGMPFCTHILAYL